MKAFVTAAAVAAAGAVLAGPAFGGYTPGVAATVDKGSTLTIRYWQGQSDAPVARVVIYAPATYGFKAPKDGATVGSITAKGTAIDLGGAVIPLAGPIVATSNPADFATGKACTGLDTHAAVFLLKPAAAGNTLPVPMYLDATVGAEQGFGAYKMTFCLRPPDIPTSAGDLRAPLGATVLDASITLKDVFVPPPVGRQPFVMLGTPYTPKTGQVNAAGTAEARTYVQYPVAFTATASEDTPGTVHAQGTLTWGGAVPANASVKVYGAHRSVVATVDASGNWSADLALPKNAKAGEVDLTVSAKPTDLTAALCPAKSVAPAGCTSGFTGGIYFVQKIPVAAKLK